MKKQSKASYLFVKVVLVLLALCFVSLCFSACGESKNDGPNYKEMLQGRWNEEGFESKPIYTYFQFTGDIVTFRNSVLKNLVAEWPYTVDNDDNGNGIIIVGDGTILTIKGNRIYDENGREYVKQ